MLLPSALATIVLQKKWSGPVSGLTHRWPMDDAHMAGNIALDVVVGLNGTIAGSVTSAAGPTTQARAFDGVSSYITLPSSPINPASAFTIATWIYWVDITEQPDGGGGLNPRFFGFDNSTTQIVGAQEASNIPGAIDIKSSGSVDAKSDIARFTNTTWQHVGFTWDTSTLLMYFNGSAIATAAGSPSGSVTGTNVLGCRQDLVRVMHGRMYQFVTYNAALSAGNMAAIYAAN